VNTQIGKFEIKGSTKIKYISWMLKFSALEKELLFHKRNMH